MHTQFESVNEEVEEIKGEVKDKEDSFKNIRIAGETQCRWRFHPGYIHSFNLTENYFVYPEQTFAWSIPMLASMPFHNKSAMDNFQWYPDEKTPENENLVRLTGCKATAKKISEDEVFCEYEVLYSGGCELAQVNYPKYNGRKYTYVYGVGHGFKRLVKLNVSDKTYKIWEPTEGIVSEPVFVPNPEQKSEDDGVVLSPVKAYGKGARPYLIVLDGKTFTELARVEFDTSRFSLDFHGFFRAAET
ncbi:hypothetical protein FSP39_014786 [Pinctada imbricata]|uniref:Uncharacterized protein n=1 Tax=Pinctada imbricata TaxID=66713 RepID=A0AA88YT39_PINIB|nr:hypothetical protein FSP39_014786 [Pinctada imbricata]